ncbi:ribosomal protein S18 acetylase RimI-like enzyme [Amorphus suaedae]
MATDPAPTAPRLRPAEARDLAAVTAIVDAAYSPYVARMGKKPGPMLDDYAGLISAGRVTVLDTAGEIAGLVVLVPEAEAMLLDNVAVAPHAHGRGFGRMLIDFAEATARRAGYTTIRLYTHEVMVENARLYVRLGYVETGRREERGYRRIYMEKAL